MAAKLSAAIAAKAATSKPVQSKDKMVQLRDKMREARDLELRISELNEKTAELAAKLTAIRTQELPDLFSSMSMLAWTLEAEGNSPPYDAELVPYYNANVPKDPTAAKACIALVAKLGGKDLVKKSYAVAFGMGEIKEALAFEKLLKTKKVEHSSKTTIHQGSLTAFVRRRYEEDKKPLDPAQLATLGATVGKVVKISKRKTT